MGLYAEAEKEIPVVYSGKKNTVFGFRIDLLVESTVVVELKFPTRGNPISYRS